MHRVVISRQAPDAMLGLPGALCVMGSSREKGHEVADIPIHVFAPPGTGEFLSTLYEVGIVYNILSICFRTEVGITQHCMKDGYQSVVVDEDTALA
jgi:hypothetical protein